MAMAVRTSGAAGLGAGAQGLVDNGLDGARATAALRAASEAPVELLGVAGKVLRTLDDTADVVIAQHVARTDNHLNSGSMGNVEPFDIKASRQMQRQKRYFQAIPN
jgi:hypothetical protein